MTIDEIKAQILNRYGYEETTAGHRNPLGMMHRTGFPIRFVSDAGLIEPRADRILNHYSKQPQLGYLVVDRAIRDLLGLNGL